MVHAKARKKEKTRVFTVGSRTVEEKVTVERGPKQKPQKKIVYIWEIPGATIPVPLKQVSGNGNGKKMLFIDLPEHLKLSETEKREFVLKVPMLKRAALLRGILFRSPTGVDPEKPFRLRLRDALKRKGPEQQKRRRFSLRRKGR